MNFDQKLIDGLIMHFAKNSLEINSENVEKAFLQLGWSQKNKDQCLTELLCDQIKIPVTHIRKYNNPD